MGRLTPVPNAFERDNLDAIILSQIARRMRGVPPGVDGAGWVRDGSDDTLRVEHLRQSYGASGRPARGVCATLDLWAADRPARQHEWEQLNTCFHETLVGAHACAWTLKLLRMLSRHGARYRRYTMRLPGSGRDVHVEHTEICEAALAGREARAALALEAHIRATTELLMKAERDGVPWW